MLTVLAAGTFGGVGRSAAVDPRVLLERANAAAEAVTTATYHFRYEGQAWPQRLHGEVRLRKGDGTDANRLWVDAVLDEEDGPRRFTIASDGREVRLVDHRARTLRHGTLRGGSTHLLNFAYYGVLFQYLQRQPFAAELAGKVVEDAGTATVGGVPCRVVRTLNPVGWDSWWYLGLDDALPRGQRVENRLPGQTGGGFHFELEALRTGVELSDADLGLPLPSGYEQIDEDARPVKVGEAAPGLRLHTPDGEEVTLEGLRGKVVVLDFWASWCMPCWHAMAAIDRLHRELSGQPVRFFGINHWENVAVDSQRFLTERGATYPQLQGDVEAAANAFKVFYLPATYVIDTQGRLALVKVGGDGAIEEDLRAAVTAALAAR